jgi:hypothetical protein
MTETWAVVAAALGSSGLTGFSALGLDWWKGRRATHSERQSSLRSACERLISSAMMLTYRAGMIQQQAVIRSGLGDSIDVLLHQRKPLDFLELSEQMFPQWEEIMAAQATIWSFGDQEVIHGANRVIGRAGDVVGLSTLPPEPSSDESLAAKAKARVQSLRPIKLDAEVSGKRDDALRLLGDECRAFAEIVRDRLGVPDPQAIIRAFPVAKVDESSEGAR